MNVGAHVGSGIIWTPENGLQVGIPIGCGLGLVYETETRSRTSPSSTYEASSSRPAEFKPSTHRFSRESEDNDIVPRIIVLGGVVLGVTMGLVARSFSKKKVTKMGASSKIAESVGFIAGVVTAASVLVL